MHTIEILSGGGHTKIAEWEATDTAMEAEARVIFERLMLRGATPYAVDRALVIDPATKERTLIPQKGADTLMRTFDPTVVEQWLFVPAVQGG